MQVPVPPLSLVFSQDSYQADEFGTAEVSCTLTEGGTPISGETITFTWDPGFGTQTETGTTNANGVANANIWFLDFWTCTVTATYENVTATCTVEYSL